MIHHDLMNFSSSLSNFRVLAKQSLHAASAAAVQTSRLWWLPEICGLLFVCVLSAGQAPAAVIYYTHGTSNGGLARIAIQEQTGQWQGHQAIEGPTLNHPKKLVITQDGGYAMVTSEETDLTWFFQLGSAPKFLKELKLGSETSEVAMIGNRALLCAGEGFFYAIDPQKAKIEKTWNAETDLSPSGRKGEDILYLPNEQVALVSFQKDSKKGKHQGNRLVVFDPQRFAAKYDLSLPRDHPELHIASDLREQGPSPEVILVAKKCNTLVLTLDLYGALAFADMNAALRGQWKNLEYLPTSLGGEWGTAFPDRGLMFEIGGKEHMLISNASDQGGIVLVNVAERKITQKFPCQAGAELPVWLPTAKKAVTVISGKVKARESSGISNEVSGQGNELFVFDLAPLEVGGDATLERITFESPVTRVESVSQGANQILLLLCGKEGAQEWLVYDLATHAILHREAAKGVVSRVAPWHPQQ